MPNKYYNDTTTSGPKGGATNMPKGVSHPMPMRTINWPGLPGKTQPKDRSGGDRKVKVHPVSKGI